MINLIPNQEKKMMTRVFYLRLLVLLLLVSSFCIFIFFIALFPSYLISQTKLNLINTKLQIQKNEIVPVPDKQTVLDIAILDRDLQTIEDSKVNPFLLTDRIINAVIIKKMSEIKISQISYQDDPNTGKLITVGGNAPSREKLLLFRQALEDDPKFKNVNLPISNFIKGSNIKFYLTLMPS